MATIAAVGDIHLAEDLRGRFRDPWQELSSRADVFLLAGDLTQHGTLSEARVVADELAVVDVPAVAVLGNHDYHSGEEAAIADLLREHDVLVLDGQSAVVETRSGPVGIAGTKGFCLGFNGRCAADFGEPEMKAFTQHGKAAASALACALSELPTESLTAVVSLTHFAPTDETLVGEEKEIWPFLGNYLIGEAIDAAEVDLAVHGHAHGGRERGQTPGGVPVRNVAQPVLRTAYGLYSASRCDSKVPMLDSTSAR